MVTPNKHGGLIYRNDTELEPPLSEFESRTLRRKRYIAANGPGWKPGSGHRQGVRRGFESRRFR